MTRNLGLKRYKVAEEFLLYANWSVLKNPDCSNELKSQLHRNFGKFFDFYAFWALVFLTRTEQSVAKQVNFTQAKADLRMPSSSSPKMYTFLLWSLGRNILIRLGVTFIWQTFFWHKVSPNTARLRLIEKGLVSHIWFDVLQLTLCS